MPRKDLEQQITDVSRTVSPLSRRMAFRRGADAILVMAAAGTGLINPEDTSQVDPLKGNSSIGALALQEERLGSNSLSVREAEVYALRAARVFALFTESTVDPVTMTKGVFVTTSDQKSDSDLNRYIGVVIPPIPALDKPPGKLSLVNRVIGHLNGQRQIARTRWFSGVHIDLNEVNRHYLESFQGIETGPRVDYSPLTPITAFRTRLLSDMLRYASTFNTDRGLNPSEALASLKAREKDPNSPVINPETKEITSGIKSGFTVLTEFKDVDGFKVVGYSTFGLHVRDFFAYQIARNIDLPYQQKYPTFEKNMGNVLAIINQANLPISRLWKMYINADIDGFVKTVAGGIKDPNLSEEQRYQTAFNGTVGSYEGVQNWNVLKPYFPAIK